MPAESNTPVATDDSEFGRGYYAFFGAVAGFFVTAALGLTVIVGYPVFQGDSNGVAAPPPIETTVPTGESGDPVALSGDPVAGQQIFTATCAACHGPGAEGLAGLGPSLIGNAFVAGLSDEELVEFIVVGRAADHPDNTTGIPMPPKGGNPSLSDEDLGDVVAYLRTLD